MTKAMKGLRPEIAKIVMPQDPVSVEDLRLRAVRAKTTLRLTNNTDVQITINALTQHFNEKSNMMRQEIAAMAASIQQPEKYQRPCPTYRANNKMMKPVLRLNKAVDSEIRLIYCQNVGFNPVDTFCGDRTVEVQINLLYL